MLDVDASLGDGSQDPLGLFVALPAIFGTFIGPAFEAVSAPGSWTATRWRRWLIPLIAIACFPPTIHPVVIIAAAIALIIRAAWLPTAVAGLHVLINDITELA